MKTLKDFLRYLVSDDDEYPINGPECDADPEWQAYVAAQHTPAAKPLKGVGHA